MSSKKEARVTRGPTVVAAKNDLFWDMKSLGLLGTAW
jgi:hypothetical protein